MSARDDYPILPSHYDEQWRAMVNEIDRLRAETKIWRTQFKELDRIAIEMLAEIVTDP